MRSSRARASSKPILLSSSMAQCILTNIQSFLQHPQVQQHRLVSLSSSTSRQALQRSVRSRRTPFVARGESFAQKQGRLEYLWSLLTRVAMIFGNRLGVDVLQALEKLYEGGNAAVGRFKDRAEWAEEGDPQEKMRCYSGGGRFHYADKLFTREELRRGSGLCEQHYLNYPLKNLLKRADFIHALDYYYLRDYGGRRGRALTQDALVTTVKSTPSWQEQRDTGRIGHAKVYL